MDQLKHHPPLHHSRFIKPPPPPPFATMGVFGMDCPSSVLFCAENNSSISAGLHGEESGSGEFGLDGNLQRSDHYEESLIGFPLHSDECLETLVSKEAEHLPKNGYANMLKNSPSILSVRREAVEWIEKVLAYYSFRPITAYLSINYLDRFLSCYELPEGKEWMTQLLSVACLSLAAKMEETLVPHSLDLQVCVPRFIFEAKTIQRMELLVLSTLEWRMQAVTPFPFVYYFLRKSNNSKSLRVPLLPQSFEVIKNITKRINFLEFKPSQIAVAVTLYVLSINHAGDSGKLLSSSHFADKERVMRCCDMIKDLAFLSSTFKCPRGSAFSASCGPNEPLDAITNNSEARTVGPQPRSSHFAPDAKRRRLYMPPTL